MKSKFTHLILCAIAASILSGCATMMGAKAPPEMRTMEKIIDFPEKSKDELYINANSWFVETFVSAESVIEFQDKEAGKIVGKYNFSYSEGVYTYRVSSVVDISIRDNKIRIVFSNPMYRTASGMGQSYTDTVYVPLESQSGVQKVRIEWSKLAGSLTNYLNTNRDW